MKCYSRTPKVQRITYPTVAILATAAASAANIATNGSINSIIDCNSRDNRATIATVAAATRATNGNTKSIIIDRHNNTNITTIATPGTRWGNPYKFVVDQGARRLTGVVGQKVTLQHTVLQTNEVRSTLRRP